MVGSAAYRVFQDPAGARGLRRHDVAASRTHPCPGDLARPPSEPAKRESPLAPLNHSRLLVSGAPLVLSIRIVSTDRELASDGGVAIGDRAPAVASGNLL